jgi:transcriptional regulator GlxA family with amidase domain
MINNTDAIIYANNCLYNYLASFKNSIFARSDLDRRQTGTIDSCIELMKENLGKNLNLQEISRLMQLSISHLSALFKEKMHDSPYNYYIFLKVQRACYLLWNTEMNIKTIALELGYEDPYHFSRVFKNMMGQSPREFRHQEG